MHVLRYKIYIKEKNNPNCFRYSIISSSLITMYSVGTNNAKVQVFAVKSTQLPEPLYFIYFSCLFFFFSSAVASRSGIFEIAGDKYGEIIHITGSLRPREHFLIVFRIIVECLGGGRGGGGGFAWRDSMSYAEMRAR